MVELHAEVEDYERLGGGRGAECTVGMGEERGCSAGDDGSLEGRWRRGTGEEVVDDFGGGDSEEESGDGDGGPAAGEEGADEELDGGDEEDFLTVGEEGFEDELRAVSFCFSL